MNPPEQRTLYGQPIHDETLRFYAKRLTLPQFVAEMRSMVGHFEEAALHYQDHGDASKRFGPKHVEAWVEQFLRLSEVCQSMPPKEPPREYVRDESFEAVIRSIV